MKVKLEEVYNLVFEGGGAKGFAYPGAYAEAVKQGLDPLRVKAVAGASAGAIQAMFVALGYSPREQIRLMMEYNWNEFFDDKFGVVRDSANLINEMGWHPGQVALEFFESCVEEKLGNHRATFIDLLEETGIRLVVVVCHAGTRLPRMMSVDTTPDVAIADAVRASMAIPFLFEPMEIDGRKYIDGGVSLNFPLTCFDRDGKKNSHTLGFRADTTEEIAYFREGIEPEPKDDPENVWDMVPVVLGAYSKAQDIAHYQANEQWRTVYIDTEEVGMLDFGLCELQKGHMIQCGRVGVLQFVEGM